MRNPEGIQWFRRKFDDSGKNAAIPVGIWLFREEVGNSGENSGGSTVIPEGVG